MNSNLLKWILRIIPTIILLQTSDFKFGAHPASVNLFSQLGVEPYGRIRTGSLELVASIFLHWPRMTRFGALLGIGLMVDTVVSHVFVIGIAHGGDGGVLFGMALVVLLCCLILVYFEREKFLPQNKT